MTSKAEAIPDWELPTWSSDSASRSGSGTTSHRRGPRYGRDRHPSPIGRTSLDDKPSLVPRAMFRGPPDLSSRWSMPVCCTRPTYPARPRIRSRPRDSRPCGMVRGDAKAAVRDVRITLPTANSTSRARLCASASGTQALASGAGEGATSRQSQEKTRLIDVWSSSAESRNAK